MQCYVAGEGIEQFLPLDVGETLRPVLTGKNRFGFALDSTFLTFTATITHALSFQCGQAAIGATGQALLTDSLFNDIQ